MKDLKLVKCDRKDEDGNLICNYEWYSKSKAWKVSCPRCGRKVSIRESGLNE